MKIVLYFLFISSIVGRFVPPPRNPLSSNQSHGHKIPSYMMKLYQTLTRNNKNNYRPEEKTILEESDTIQSLIAKNFMVEGNRWLLTFDFSTVSRYDELQMVELQVYLPPSTKSRNVTVDIYNIDKHCLGSVTRTIPNKAKSAWTAFNVTEIIEQSLPWEKTIHQQGGMKSQDMSDHGHSKTKRHDVPVHENNKNQAVILFFTKQNPLAKQKTALLIQKLAMDTMKRIPFYGPKRSKTGSQLDTPNNIYPTAEKEDKHSFRKMDRINTKKIFSSLKGSVLLQ